MIDRSSESRKEIQVLNTHVWNDGEKENSRISTKSRFPNALERSLTHHKNRVW